MLNACTVVGTYMYLLIYKKFNNLDVQGYYESSWIILRFIHNGITVTNGLSMSLYALEMA